VGTALASTWNKPLLEEVGKAMGNEVKEYGADVLLNHQTLTLVEKSAVFVNYAVLNRKPWLLS